MVAKRPTFADRIAAVVERVCGPVFLEDDLQLPAPRPMPTLPPRIVAYVECDLPLTGAQVTHSAAGMVLLLLSERDRCVREEKEGRGCPAPYASWAAVLARIDGELARLEGGRG